MTTVATCITSHQGETLRQELKYPSYLSSWHPYSCCVYLDHMCDVFVARHSSKCPSQNTCSVCKHTQACVPRGWCLVQGTGCNKQVFTPKQVLQYTSCQHPSMGYPFSLHNVPFRKHRIACVNTRTIVASAGTRTSRTVDSPDTGCCVVSNICAAPAAPSDTSATYTNVHQHATVCLTRWFQIHVWQLSDFEHDTHGKHY